MPTATASGLVACATADVTQGERAASGARRRHKKAVLLLPARPQDGAEQTEELLRGRPHVAMPAAYGTRQQAGDKHDEG